MAKYDTFAERNLNIINISGDEAMCRCLYHDDSNASMQFNVETGLWVCFGCGAKGTIKKLERELGLRVVEDQIDVTDLIARLKEISDPEFGKVVDLPVVPESTLLKYKFPTKYWAKRGFTDETIEIFQLGYDPIGDIATIPFRNSQGGLQGIIRRFLEPGVELRYKYPKGFKRSMHMFGSWLVADDPEIETVALVEGSLDAVKCWQAGVPAMAVYGSSVSKAQIKLLRRLGITNVVLFFDNDDAGVKARLRSSGIKVHSSKDRNGKTYKYAEYDPALDLGREFLVTEVQYTKGMPSDPGAMSDDQILEAFDNATPVDYDEIKSFMKQHKKRTMRRRRL